MGDAFLRGRVAMITGGASGMGRAIALALAGAGADVSIGSLVGSPGSLVDGELAHLPARDALERTAAEIESLGVRALACDLDVTVSASIAAFHARTLETLGPTDILVNAAGITAEQTVSGHADSLWLKVVDVNLNGTYRTTRACLPAMMERGWGRIVNIASTAASVGAPASAAYCASKAGVVGLTKCVALEGAEHGVTCNSISPGWVETSFGTEWMTHIAETGGDQTGEQYMDQARADNPQKRMIQPSEIGSLALWLCRDEARGVTMQDLTVSAGSLW